jgi:hypothetical protein
MEVPFSVGVRADVPAVWYVSSRSLLSAPSANDNKATALQTHLPCPPFGKWFVVDSTVAAAVGTARPGARSVGCAFRRRGRLRHVGGQNRSPNCAAIGGRPSVSAFGDLPPD